MGTRSSHESPVPGCATVINGPSRFWTVPFVLFGSKILNRLRWVVPACCHIALIDLSNTDIKEGVYV